MSISNDPTTQKICAEECACYPPINVLLLEYLFQSSLTKVIFADRFQHLHILLEDINKMENNFVKRLKAD